jgi:leucyl-tRNA synthetase
MFGYRWSEGGPWTAGGIDGAARWLRRSWSMIAEPARPSGPSGEQSRAQQDLATTLKVLRRRVHQTLQGVTADFENFEFNTIVSSLMELLNDMQKAREAGAAGTPEWNEAVEIYLKMLAPVAPHMAEELWTEQLGKPYSIHRQHWPAADAAAAREDVIEIPVQVNGKVRDRITVSADATEEQIRAAALASEGVKRHLDGKEPKKVIVAQKKLVSVVV